MFAPMSYGAHIQRACQIVGSQNKLARAIGAHQGQVWQWYHERAAVPAKYAPLIARVTSGKVTPAQVCPELAKIFR